MARGKAIIIGGGVGPMAGVALHRMIIENTLTDGRDQDHLDVHHFSLSRLVPDRTAWLLRETGAEDPAAGMAAVFRRAARSLDGAPAVAGVPCNTFHAPAIFGAFLAQIADLGVQVVHMLEETVLLARARAPEARRIGVLSTTGTRRSGVYEQLLSGAGLECLYVAEEDQAAVHAAIYDREWGLKAVSPATPRARETVEKFARGLVREGAELVILACTELPLGLPGDSFEGLPLVDPTLALARALVREAAPAQLKPLSDT